VKKKPSVERSRLDDETLPIINKGVYHTAALPFTLKDILRQKKNHENSNISSCKNIIVKKSSQKKKSKILQDIRSL
jgi:hypothetical protein